MFYDLSKILWFFVAPSNALAILVATGAALAVTRFAAIGRRLALGAAAGLLIVGLSPLGSVLLLPLESRFPASRAASLPPPDGIVVLGGAVDARISRARGDPLELNEAGDRIAALVALARRFPRARLAFSGGAGEYLAGPVPEADEVAAKIAALGVDPARIVFENRSRNTWENALFSLEVVRPGAGERWLLVTSAFHMPRAIGCFRAAGFPVEAYPVDYRTAGSEDAWRPFGRVSAGLHAADLAVKEWVGLAAYRLSGKTDALFPALGPSP